MKIYRPLVFFDIESTGVDPAVDRIIEFGAVTLRPNETRSPRYCQRFNPGVPIPAEATEVHGITDDDVAAAPPFSAFAPRILEAMRGKDIAGYNLWRFDLPMLDEELRRCRLKLDLADVCVIDCYGIFAKKAPRKLEDAVRRYCGREHEGAHGAGADADATLDVFLGQMAAHEDLAAMTPAELALYSLTRDFRPADVAGKIYRDKEGRLRFGFGKNQDQLVSDNLEYVQWMLRKGNFPGSTVEVLRKETGL